jgi:hypothetical protein
LFDIPLAQRLEHGAVLDHQDEHALGAPILAEVHVLERHAVPEPLGGFRRVVAADLAGRGHEEMLAFHQLEDQGAVLTQGHFVGKLLDGAGIDPNLLFRESGFAAADDGFVRTAEFHEMLPIGQAQVVNLEFQLLRFFGDQDDIAAVDAAQFRFQRAAFA